MTPDRNDANLFDFASALHVLTRKDTPEGRMRACFEAGKAGFNGVLTKLMHGDADSLKQLHAVVVARYDAATVKTA